MFKKTKPHFLSRALGFLLGLPLFSIDNLLKRPAEALEKIEEQNKLFWTIRQYNIAVSAGKTEGDPISYFASLHETLPALKYKQEVEKAQKSRFKNNTNQQERVHGLSSFFHGAVAAVLTVLHTLLALITLPLRAIYYATIKAFSDSWFAAKRGGVLGVLSRFWGRRYNSAEEFFYYSHYCFETPIGSLGIKKASINSSLSKKAFVQTLLNAINENKGKPILLYPSEAGYKKNPIHCAKFGKDGQEKLRLRQATLLQTANSGKVPKKQGASHVIFNRLGDSDPNSSVKTNVVAYCIDLFWISKDSQESKLFWSSLDSYSQHQINKNNSHKLYGSSSDSNMDFTLSDGNGVVFSLGEAISLRSHFQSYNADHAAVLGFSVQPDKVYYQTRHAVFAVLAIAALVGIVAAGAFFIAGPAATILAVSAVVKTALSAVASVGLAPVAMALSTALSVATTFFTSLSALSIGLFPLGLLLQTGLVFAAGAVGSALLTTVFSGTWASLTLFSKGVSKFFSGLIQTAISLYKVQWLSVFRYIGEEIKHYWGKIKERLESFFSTDDEDVDIIDLNVGGDVYSSDYSSEDDEENKEKDTLGGLVHWGSLDESSDEEEVSSFSEAGEDVVCDDVNTDGWDILYINPPGN